MKVWIIPISRRSVHRIVIFIDCCYAREINVVFFCFVNTEMDLTNIRPMTN